MCAINCSASLANSIACYMYKQRYLVEKLTNFARITYYPTAYFNLISIRFLTSSLFPHVYYTKNIHKDIVHTHIYIHIHIQRFPMWLFKFNSTLPKPWLLRSHMKCKIPRPNTWNLGMGSFVDHMVSKLRIISHSISTLFKWWLWRKNNHKQ